MNKNLRWPILLTAILAFSAGFVTAADHSDGSISRGLVKALGSVGENLFGEGNFGVSVVAQPPPNDGIPAVQIDLATMPPPDDNIPILLNIFDPGAASCVAIAQVAATTTGLSVYAGNTGGVTMLSKPLGEPPEPCRDGNVIDPGPG